LQPVIILNEVLDQLLQLGEAQIRSLTWANLDQIATHHLVQEPSSILDHRASRNTRVATSGTRRMLQLANLASLGCKTTAAGAEALGLVSEWVGGAEQKFSADWQYQKA
jgi:hypothetical protein